MNGTKIGSPPDHEYAVNEFLDTVYRQTLPAEDMLSCPQKRLKEEQEKLTAGIRELLCADRMKRELTAPLSWEKRETRYEDGVRVEKYALAGLKNLVMPVYAALPDKANGRLVLYLHGHDPMGALAAVAHLEPQSYHQWIALRLAKEGYTVLAPELMGFGEANIRGYPYEEGKRHHCYPVSVRLLACGYSLTGVRVLEAQRVLDLAEKMGFGEAALVGISGGAMAGSFLAVLDSRIRAAVLSACANTYEDSLFASRHCLCNYIPGMAGLGDLYQILACAAPKPLFVMNGDWKQGFPVSGTEKAFAGLKQVYERMGAGENLETLIFKVDPAADNKIDAERTVSWLNGQYRG